MADSPIVFALANPTPEIMPDVARKASPNALIATGRSDFPNQVNNVLCFPFIFRGALDVGATDINDAMKIACVDAIASLAREAASAELGDAYQGERLSFGPDYLIPKPFDPRELVARINTIVKRKQPAPNANTQIKFDGITIDTEQREVYVGDKLIVLTTMEYQLLLMMAESPGKDFSRDDILNALKGTETELFSRSVDILISRLRSKLKPTEPIKTIYGAGYAFVGKRVVE